MALLYSVSVALGLLIACGAAFWAFAADDPQLARHIPAVLAWLTLALFAFAFVANRTGTSWLMLFVVVWAAAWAAGRRAS